MAEVRNNCPTDSPFKEAVCIDAGRVYDSCCDRDCLERLRLYFKPCDQSIINDAINVKIRNAEVIKVLVDVEPVHLNRGFFSCDITFFFLVKIDVFTAPHCQPISICGICSADKKVILYGSDGNVKVFSNETTREDAGDPQSPATSNLPRCVVSCVDPVPLSAQLCEPCRTCCCHIPTSVTSVLGGDVCCAREGEDRSVEVTLGLFTIVQLIRNVQMLVPVYDFCIPEKECNNSSDTPCDLFSRIRFPMDDFFPPRPCDVDEGCGCGCGRSSDGCGCCDDDDHGCGCDDR